MQRSQRKPNEPNKFKSFRSAVRTLIRLNYVRWLRVYRNNACNIIKHCCPHLQFCSPLFILLHPALARSLAPFGSVPFRSLILCTLSVFAYRSLRKIEFISIHLFFYWIFRSIRFRWFFMRLLGFSLHFFYHII